MSKVSIEAIAEKPDIYFSIHQVELITGLGKATIKSYINAEEEQVHFSDVLPIADSAHKRGIALRTSFNAIAASIIDTSQMIDAAAEEAVKATLDSFFMERSADPSVKPGP